MDNTFKVQEEEGLWEGQEVDTGSVQLEDTGKGKQIFVRQFSFTIPEGLEKPSDEQLIAVHKSKIMAFLWKDELVWAGIMKVAWDVENERMFHIFVLAEAKSGSVILETPQLLNGQPHI